MQTSAIPILIWTVIEISLKHCRKWNRQRFGWNKHCTKYTQVRTQKKSNFNSIHWMFVAYIINLFRLTAKSFFTFFLTKSGINFVILKVVSLASNINYKEKKKRNLFICITNIKLLKLPPLICSFLKFRKNKSIFE